MLNSKRILNQNALPFLILLSFLTSCGPSANSALLKRYPTLAFDEEVLVLAMNDTRPENIEELGTLRIRDSGFSVNCNLEQVVESAKLEARKAGGNIIHITKHKKPNFWSTCHRIDATILRTTN